MAVNFNLNLLYKLYSHDSSKGGTQGGLIDQNNFGNSYTVSGDKVVVTEADGDTFTYNLAQLSEADAEKFFSEDLNSDKLIGEVKTGAANNSNAANGTNGTNGTTPTSKTREEVQAEMDELRKKMDILKNKMSDNDAKIQALEKEIDAIYGDIEKTVSQYIDKAEDIAEELKEEVKKVTQEEIEKYKRGEYKSTSELHDAIEKDVDGLLSSSAISGLMSELESALNQKKAEADPLIAQVNNLKVENQTMKMEYDTLAAKEINLDDDLQAAIDEAKKAEEAKKSCDPQGFAIKDANGTTTQFDFFVDRDGNGELSDSSEFLGAQSYATGGKDAAWGEMKALDTNNDGSVDMKELEAANVRVVMTTVDANGNKTQKSMFATDAFGKDSDLKISTTQNSTTSQSDVPVGFNDFEGNQLLGNFNVTYNRETYTGYQTADTAEYLNANYKFSSGDATNDTKEVMNNALLLNTTEFKYDISKLVDGVKNVAKEDLMAIAEDVCAAQGIHFAQSNQAKETTGENAQNANNQALSAAAAQQNLPQELADLQRELEEYGLIAA